MTTLYNEDNIKTLSSLEHIRQRPGMYIGRMGNGSNPADGIYVLLKEIVDNAVDEFVMGCGKKILIKLENNAVRVRDFGRGIPHGKLVDCVSIINTGGKFNDDVFQFSVGMNGVGTKAVNALSQRFEARSFRGKVCKEAVFENGKLISETSFPTEEPDGTEVFFHPEDGLLFFPQYKFNPDFIAKRLQRYAYLNTGLSLYLNDTRFFSRNGLQDHIEDEVEEESRLYPVIYHRTKNLEFAFCHTADYSETYYSYVNGQYTNDGGTHLSAFREGVLRGISEFAGKNLEGEDVRAGIVGVVAIKIKEPIFESQTKNKLGNTDVRTWIVHDVKEAVAHFLHRHQEVAEILMEKIERNQTIRNEVKAVRQIGKEAAKRTALKIPKLRDCKYHFNETYRKPADIQLAEESSIFITEGDSAAGVMIEKRNVNTQAIFALKGKPLNVHKARKKTKNAKEEKASEKSRLSALYTNMEFFNIMKALGVEDSVENLRYAKIIIATDADTDGMHIRNLVLTFFLTYFDQLIRSGHVYILETPLYRVRKNSTVRYCYDDAERDAALKELGAQAEMTRFKGLGEISPGEFGQFIGKDIRLTNVPIDHMHGIGELLEFYMGDNNDDRKQYIMQHLRDVMP